MKTSKEQLRALIAHIEAGHEEEKIRLARTLHDDLSQKLTALLIELSLLEDSFAGKKEGAKLAELSSLVTAISQSVRKMTNELRLKILDEFGLVAAMKHETERITQQTKACFALHVKTDELKLPPGMAAGVFHVFQKIARHIIARPSTRQVTVHIEDTGKEVILRMSDDCKVRRGKPVYLEGSMELLNIREHVERLGGTVQFVEVQSGGTIATVKIRKQASAPKKRSAR